MRRIPLLLILGLLSLSSAAAEEGLWGSRGIPKRFVAAGELLYAADGRGVTVYDVANPAAITQLDVESTGDETFDVSVDGTRLVAATSAGLELYEVHADGRLSILFAHEEEGGVTRVAAQAGRIAAAAGSSVAIYEPGDGELSLVRRLTFTKPVIALEYVESHLYVSVESQAVYVFAPDSAEEVERLRYVPWDFALSGVTLWMVSGLDGLRAIDVSDPAAPEIIGSAGLGQLDLRGVAASGDLVVAFESPGRIHLFDGSSPEAPLLEASFDEWVEAIAVTGDSIFVAGQIVDDEGMKKATGRPVRVFDASDRHTPVLAGEFRDLAGPVSGVWTDGSLAYVVDAPYLRVLDVSTTAEPRLVGSIYVPAIEDTIRVKGARAIVYGRANVNVVDVSRSGRPRFLGTWDAEGHPRSGAALTSGSRFAEANEHSGLHIVDFPDEGMPVLVGHRIWHYHDLAAGDDAVYLLQVGGTIRTVELAGGATVVERSTTLANGDRIDTAPPNSDRPHHLVVAAAGGIQILSLADRFFPVETRFLPTAAAPGAMATTGETVYFALGGALHEVGLVAGRPVDTGIRMTSPMQISAAGGKIVVADRYAVRVFGPDTAPPAIAPAKRRSGRR